MLTGSVASEEVLEARAPKPTLALSLPLASEAVLEARAPSPNPTLALPLTLTTALLLPLTPNLIPPAGAATRASPARDVALPRRGEGRCRGSIGEI